MAKQKLTVQDAAEALDISVDAVRQRIRRGKLSRAMPPDGDDKRVYVWLDLDETANGGAASHDVHEANGDELLEAYRDQVAFLRRELERKDAIILTMAQRIPELEAPHEARNGPETQAPAPDRADHRPADNGAQEAAEPRPSWWRRLLFGA